MALRVSLLMLMVTLLLVGSSACFVEELKSIGFTYSGVTGPQRWGRLSPYFSACNGKKQSPLNLAKDHVVRMSNFKPLTRNYLALNATLYNNGFNIGVHFDGQIAGTLDIDGKNYNLKQLHWHSPSEHRINGVQFPAELHLVHLADDNSIAVVATLFQYGKNDSFISQIKDQLAELNEEVCRRDKDAHVPLGNIDMKEFDKKTRKYWRYVGSLSSPPCTENVVWNILGKQFSMKRTYDTGMMLRRAYSLHKANLTGRDCTRCLCDPAWFRGWTGFVGLPASTESSTMKLVHINRWNRNPNWGGTCGFLPGFLAISRRRSVPEIGLSSMDETMVLSGVDRNGIKFNLPPMRFMASKW